MSFALKIMLAYPPLPQAKGVPQLSQNRQFQWFSHCTTIYPVVMASAATLLQQAGFPVLWKDAIAEGMKTPEFHRYLLSAQPDLLAIETKTPVIQQHLHIITQLKELAPLMRRLPGAGFFVLAQKRG